MRRFACLIVLFAAATSARAQVVHYRAEGDYNDASGNGRTATVNGTVGFRASKAGFGQGFDVDNVVNTAAINYLTTPGLSGANASILGGSGLTVAAFFNEDNFANNGSLVNLRTGNDSGFTLEPAFGAPGSMLFVVFTATGMPQITVPGFTVGQTHHIAATFDPANQLVSVYRDGQFVASAPTADTNPMKIDPDDTFLIGRNAFTTTGFDGLIDELRVYNRPLTAGEIAALVPEPSALSAVLLPAVLLRRRQGRERSART